MLSNSSDKQNTYMCTMNKTVLKYTQNAAILKNLKHSIEIIGIQKKSILYTNNFKIKIMY